MGGGEGGGAIAGDWFGDRSLRDGSAASIYIKKQKRNTLYPYELRTMDRTRLRGLRIILCCASRLRVPVVVNVF